MVPYSNRTPHLESRRNGRRREERGQEAISPRRSSQDAPSALRRQSSTGSSAYSPRKNETKKRPRPSANLPGLRMNAVESPRKSQVDRRLSRDGKRLRDDDEVEQAVMQLENDPKRKLKRKRLRKLRTDFEPSLRTYDEIVAYYTTELHITKLNGAARLSRLSLNAARQFVARGQLDDLSKIPDDFVHDILTHADVGPEILVNLENLNPSRTNVLEAVWARLVDNKFSERALPEGVLWWRELYEMRKGEALLTFEKAKMLMKFSERETLRKSRSLEIAKVVIRKRKRPSASTSRIAQLRAEVRRDKSRRRYI